MQKWFKNEGNDIKFWFFDSKIPEGTIWHWKREDLESNDDSDDEEDDENKRDARAVIYGNYFV